MNKILKLFGYLLLFIFFIFAYVLIFSSGLIGKLPQDYEVIESPRPQIDDSASTNQIFFGDLHVHTTFSQDAFLFSLPVIQGEGAHPPADACNFARFCSSLDFFSITDHAEGLTKEMWEDTIKSIKNCDAVSNDDQKDLIAFAGWEWTQMASTPETHYGHKNVILRDLDNLPEKPIGAGLTGLDLMIKHYAAPLLPLIVDFPPEQIDFDFLKYRSTTYSEPFCADLENEENVKCKEKAENPKQLFEQLDKLNLEALVIPHGTAWGIHAPAGSNLSYQLLEGQHDPEKQRLIEVYSGHGNSEIFKDFKHAEQIDDGSYICPDPTDDFEPCCWRAGEIIKQRCENESEESCIVKAEKVKKDFANDVSGILRFGLVENTTPEDWMQCGQLKNEFLPAYTYRPGMSAQAALASKIEEKNVFNSFKLGLIGSTDNHKARAGSGYKEFARKSMGDSWGAKDNLTWLLPPERGASFYSTGGLVAVHAPKLERNAIYNSLYQREVYATSGERILLWFNLLDSENGITPMGRERNISQKPQFEVTAIGSFKQKPGCPEYVYTAMSAEEISRLCLNECYNPSNERNKIDRIEIVKITPTTELDSISNNIQDPWKVFTCNDKGEGCSANFFDDEYVLNNKSSLYYARAIQEPTNIVGGDPLRCELNEAGECIKIRPCYSSGPDFDPNDDCLAPVGERAWSSPIFLTHPMSIY